MSDIKEDDEGGLTRSVRDVIHSMGDFTRFVSAVACSVCDVASSMFDVASDDINVSIFVRKPKTPPITSPTRKLSMGILGLPKVVDEDNVQPVSVEHMELLFLDSDGVLFSAPFIHTSKPLISDENAALFQLSFQLRSPP